MSERQGYMTTTWERRLYYVAPSHIIQWYSEPDDPATEGQIKWAEKLGMEITDYMKGGRLGVPNISMSEMNHLIYSHFGAERYRAIRGTIEREYESRRPTALTTDRMYADKALGRPLVNPHGQPSKRSLSSLNLRGLLVLVEPPREVVPWSHGEAIKVVKTNKRRKGLPDTREMISELRLLNALGGLDVDLENGVPLDKDDVLDHIDARLPTQMALRHIELWGTVERSPEEIEASKVEPVAVSLSNGKPWWVEDDDDQA